MDEWTDEFFNSAIRAIMTAPRGQPSHNLLDAFHRAYSQHEMDKCFSEDKKNYDLDAVNGSKVQFSLDF